MKISIALTLLTAKLAVASIKIAKFGGCHNQTAVEDNLKFHCQYDSTSCNDGEVWLNSFEAEDQGFGTCTCDDDYNNNVFGYACYDMKNTHAVECAANGDQCPEGWYHIGERFNSAHNVDDMCGHGDAAFGDDTSSCGKRCTCNFQYQSRDTALTIGSTTYGMCHDEAADTNYCAVHKDTCHGSETFYNPHSAGVSGFDCTCENVHVGGCMDGSSFSHCGVAQDSCKQGQMFLAPRALREANGDVDCRLCHDSWSECTEKEMDMFYLKEKDDSAVTKKCKWLIKKSKKRKKRICKKDRSNDDFGSANEVCPVTCGKCTPTAKL